MLFQPLFTHAQQNPQDVAIIDDKGQYTYQQLAAAAAGLGMYLSVQTNRPSVGLLLPPSAGFAASFYGTLLVARASSRLITSSATARSPTSSPTAASTPSSPSRSSRRASKTRT